MSDQEEDHVGPGGGPRGVELPPRRSRLGGRSTPRRGAPSAIGAGGVLASSRGRLPAPMGVEELERAPWVRLEERLVRLPFLTRRTYLCRFAPFCSDLVLFL